MSPSSHQPSRETHPTRFGLSVAVVFLLGLAAGAIGISALRPAPQPIAQPHAEAGLSESTKNLLNSLKTPVDLRFYSILDPATTSETLRSFAARAEKLVSAFGEASGGNVRLTRVSVVTENAAAPSADGIQPFNHDRGNACFLGLAISQDARTESLPFLSPQWEAALEYDIARAIQRVSQPLVAKPPTARMASAEKQTVDKLRAALPNLDSLSLDAGKRKLQEKTLAEFKAVAAEMSEQVNRAQQQLDEAQRGGSETEQQAAMQQLQKLQADQSDRLKTISIDLQEQIAALERLKNSKAP